MKTLTRGTVFDPAFQTSVGALEAGTAFALAIPGRPPLLITRQHLFGPAGGLSKGVPPQFMSRFVERVPGASGAPVITESGQFVGMVVRFKQPSPATTVAMLLPAASIHTPLMATDIPDGR
jgi:hypothetical protein